MCGGGWGDAGWGKGLAREQKEWMYYGCIMDVLWEIKKMYEGSKEKKGEKEKKKINEKLPQTKKKE